MGSFLHDVATIFFSGIAGIILGWGIVLSIYYIAWSVLRLVVRRRLAAAQAKKPRDIVVEEFIKG